MHKELQIGIESVRILRTNPGKYLNRIKGLYFLSLADCEVGQIGREAYVTLKCIDDLLDGDRDTMDDPLTHVQNIQKQIADGEAQTNEWIVQFAEHVIQSLNQKAKPGDTPRTDFLSSIDGMIFDYERARIRQSLSMEQLEEYYRQTFAPVLNLLFIGLNSKIRAKDVPALVYTRGAIYSIRDLKEDWEHGLINIPEEILSLAKLSEDSTYSQVMFSSVIQSWIKEQIQQSNAEIAEAEETLNRTNEWLTIKVGKGILKPMRRFVDENER